MQLHNLAKLNRKSRKRIGRGGKRGSYSGRGVKGQKSRAGRRMRPAERDLILRFPKKRGFANKPKSSKPAIFNLKDLLLKLKANSTGGAVVLDKKFLFAAGFLSKNYKVNVKILGDGDITIPVRVQGLQISRNARAKIEKAGGSVRA